MKKYYALVDGELGVLAVGTRRLDGVRDYAEWLMNEAGDDYTVEQRIDMILDAIVSPEVPLAIEECTPRVYDDFNMHGNATSYTTNDAGLLDLWPEDDEEGQSPC